MNNSLIFDCELAEDDIQLLDGLDERACMTNITFSLLTLFPVFSDLVTDWDPSECP